MSFQNKYKAIENTLRAYFLINKGNHSSSPLYLYNYFDVSAEDMWLSRFMKKRGISNNGKRISFYSVFGDRQLVRYDKRDVKVFVTGENVHLPQFLAYSDNMLSNGDVDLSLGFDYLDDEHYLRFPLWLRTAFRPEWSEREIVGQVQRLRYPEIAEHNCFAAMIARYDWNNTRSQIYSSLKHLGEIKCPSSVHHNDESLTKVYNDDKVAYLRQFCFNICPENSNHPGYVTEKIFDAISAGCIPIYWGSDNHPEPDVLNQEAIILWDFASESSIKACERLCSNKMILDETLHQARLVDNAEDVIINYFDSLQNALKMILD